MTSMTCTWSASQTTASSMRAKASFRGHHSFRSNTLFAKQTHRSKSAVLTVTAGFVKYGVREDPSPGDTTTCFLETYGLDLGGGAIHRETLEFGVGSEAVALEIKRPLGIVFEDVGGKCVAVEVVEGSNASYAGVLAGDILRLTSAVAIGKSYITVGKFAVEPSLGQRKKGENRKACFFCDGQPFPNVMDAIVSNSEEVKGEVVENVSLLLERPE